MSTGKVKNILKFESERSIHVVLFIEVTLSDGTS